jgi:hypothetical protein
MSLDIERRTKPKFHPPLFSSPSFLEGIGVAFRGGLPLAHATGNPQAGGDGGQYGRDGLNDEFYCVFFHDRFFF